MKFNHRLIFGNFLFLSILFIILEEVYIGGIYVALVNHYSKEIFLKINVERNYTKDIGIAVVLQDKQNEIKYEMAIDTVKCYADYFKYDLHIIYINEYDRYKSVCQNNDFMFHRHCILSKLMGDRKITNEWILFLDADMGIVNPNHLIESFLPDDSTEIVFYQRIMNQEVMAGSYLIKNTGFGREFLQFWAEYEKKLPNGFHGTDNGAIHSAIVEFSLPEKNEERKHCEKFYWSKSKDYATLTLYEVCMQMILKSSTMNRIKILDKRSYKWARDGWLSNSIFCANDFIFHGWQKRRLDKRIFASWHSPIVYDRRFNLSLCSTDKAYYNWRYKDSFYTSIEEVEKRVNVYIAEQEKIYKETVELIKVRS